MKNKIIYKLKDIGIKVTPQRIAIIELLEKTKKHLSAEEIFETIKKDFPTISLATVYNTLEKLVELNEIIKLKISDDNKINYEYNLEPHHHFYCQKCGKIIDIEIVCNISKLGNIEGHQVNEMHGYFKGICKDCLTNQK